MRFDELTRGLAGHRSNAHLDPKIESIAYDSRKVTPGTLFVALIGSRADAHSFIPSVIEQGAAALLLDQRSHLLQEATAASKQIASLSVSDTRRELSRLANRFYDEPFSKLTSLAVTGTNGKTTTTFLIESIFKAAARPCALIGTVFFRLDQWEIHGVHTTPESLELFQLLDGFLRRGAKAVALEASSHGLSMNRLDEALFDVGVFTNLTTEHLDFHGDLESYFMAKRKLFSELLPASRRKGKAGLAVINQDDPYGRRLIEELSPDVLTYGMEPSADVHAVNVRHFRAGCQATIHLRSGAEFACKIPLPGRFNLSNALAACAAAEACGVEPDSMVQGLSQLGSLPGRMERFEGPKGSPTVYVDYAHTPHALENALTALRELAPEFLWVLFGCGGDRDQHKRSLMGKVAGSLADIVIVTTDNPRFEDPLGIIDQIVPGLSELDLNEISSLGENLKGYLVITDRATAIAEAISSADERVLLLVAGKGHEDTQEIRGVRSHLSDRELVRSALNRWHRSEEAS